jgi:hypothetical protein
LGLSIKNRFWTFINVQNGKAAPKPATTFFKKVTLLENGHKTEKTLKNLWSH